MQENNGVKHLSLPHKKALSVAQRKRYEEGRNTTAFKVGHIPTLEMRKKMGTKGANNHFWKGGLTYDLTQYEYLWRRKNLEHSRAYMRAWKKNHRTQANIGLINYRAKVRAAKGSFTIKEWENKKEDFGNRCVVCKKARKLTVDHIIPISRNGSNYIENIQPLCESCNYSKQDRLMNEFILWRKAKLTP